jgi:hypothetical protein
MPRLTALLSCLLPLLFGACVGGGQASGPAVQPHEWRALQSAELVDALLIVDEIESRGDPSAAAWLLPMLRDRERGHELRAGVAAALMTLGFDEGQSFCLAVLRANLDSARDSDARFGLPISDRWAFARELAYEPIASRLWAAGVEPRSFDVNFGAPDLRKASDALEAQLAELPPLNPSLDAAGFERRLPAAPPPGWARAEYRSWHMIRAELLRRGR